MRREGLIMLAVVWLSLVLLTWIAAPRVSAEAVFVNLIPNPGFEHDVDQDQLPDQWEKAEASGSSLRVETPGYRSQRAISLLGQGSWRTRLTGLHPQRYYLLSLWVQREQFVDGEYPSIRLFGQTLFFNELFAWGAWLRYSWLLNSMEHTDTVLELSTTHMRSRVWFDDLQLVEFAVQPSSPREGATVSELWPRLHWALPEDERVFQLRIEVADTPSFDRPLTFETVSPQGNGLAVRHPLAQGRWYWRVTVSHNGTALAQSAPASFIYRPFFPLGIYGAEPEAFAELQQAGFNSVQLSAADEERLKTLVAAAEQHGLKALINLPSTAWQRPLSAFFTELNHSDGVLAWYLEDEPEGRAVSPTYLWKLRAFLQQQGSLYPTSLVLVRAHRAADYSPAVDIVMTDPYPIPHRPVTWLSNELHQVKSALSAHQQAWAVIQAFSWADVPLATDTRAWGRLPTYEEERLLSYLAVMHGAQGLFYYAYRMGEKTIAANAEHWQALRRVVTELQSVSPLLTAPAVDTEIQVTAHPATGTDPALDADGRPAVHVRLKRLADDAATEGSMPLRAGLYLMAANVTAQPLQATFSHPQLFAGDAEVLFEARRLAGGGHQFVDHFTPYAVHLYYVPGSAQGGQ